MPKALNPLSVLVRPMITEKATRLGGENKYMFEVRREANKTQIKEAVEKGFDVTVMDVNVMVMKGKPRRIRGNRIKHRPDWKKAVVTLAAGRQDRAVRGRIDMPIKQYKPTSPGRRGASGHTFEEITRSKPEKSLLAPRRSKPAATIRAGSPFATVAAAPRDAFRIIDFKRDKTGVPGKVATIEYDPNRSGAHRARPLRRRREALHPLARGRQSRRHGDVAGPTAEIKPGNALPLRNIPSGTVIHNLELHKGKGAQLVRGAGGAAQLLAREDDYALVRLPSGEVRRILADCMATIGQVGNVGAQPGQAGQRRPQAAHGPPPHVCAAP